MKDATWARYLVAAALVLLVGAVWVLADEMEVKVEVRNDNGEEITVDVNGATEVITLEDLVPGEERTWDVGGHPVTVKRVDDHLVLVHGDGEGQFFHVGEGDGNMVWVTEDVEGGEDGRRIIIRKRVEGAGDGNFVFIGDGEHEQRNVVVIKGKDGELDLEELKARYGDDFEETHTADGETVLKWVSEGDEEHPMIITTGTAMGGDMVVYRCEETGSMLTVKADENLLDSYLDPVTGCVLKKIEGSGQRVIHVEVITKEETDD
jgi:hypothetical protein